MQKKKSRASKTRTRSKILLASALVGIVIFGAPVSSYADTTETEAETETEAAYSEDDLYLLSHLICGEVEGCSRQMKTYVGSVVLNRIADSRFPNTLKEVIYQNNPLQYSCTVDGNFEKEPGEETIEVAKYLLENGSQLPPNVIFQAEFKQGTGTYGEPLLAPNGVEMYFCTG